MATTTIRVTGEELMKHRDWEEVLWHTPGPDAPYWASRASWRDDVVVATVRDFLEAAGYDELDGLEEEEFELEVQLP